MQTNLTTFLKQIANKEELTGNKLAWVIANYADIDKSDKKTFYESLVKYYPISPDIQLKRFEIETDKDEKELQLYYNKDFRIKSIKLANIRGIPKREDDSPYGISLSEGNQTNNAIILGSNGSGKSSIYESLEYLFCQRIGEAELRTSQIGIKSESDYFKGYLSHFNNSFNNSFCQVLTNEGIFDIHKNKPFPEFIKSKINPDTHFISDFDIYEKGQLDYEASNDKSFHYLIAKSLGLESFLNFNKLINQFNSYRRNTESRNRSRLEAEQKSVNENLIKWRNEIEIRKKQINDIDKANMDVDVKMDFTKYLTALSNAKNNDFIFSYKDVNFESVIGRFYNSYNKYRNVSKKKVNTSEIEFLNIGQELLEFSDNCPLCESSTLSISDIKKKVTLRLELIKEISEIRKKSKLYFDEATSLISSIRSTFINFRNKIKAENEELIKTPDFNKLIKLNNSFSDSLKKTIEDDFIVNASTFDNHGTSSEKSFNQLFEIILDNKETVKTIFPLVVKLTDDYNLERKKLLVDVEKLIQKKTQVTKPYEQKAFLKKEIQDFVQQITQNENRLKTLEKELSDANKQFELYQTIKREAIIYSKIINIEINSIVNNSFEPIRDIVTSILKDYMKNDSVFLEINKEPDEYDSETGEVLSEFISIKVIGKNSNGISLSPNKYFNTFRYRLFSMMIGISVAIASRNLTKINLPLVLDDIFYASDFEKRNSIVTFIKKLFRIFDAHSTLPFQLIFFTHDELIFESVLTALIDIEKDMETIFTKLLPVSEAEKQKDYWELSYRMPNSIPDFVSKELLTL